MMRTLLITLLLASAGCTQSPALATITAPSPLPSPLPLALALAWHRTAPGCTPAQPAPAYSHRTPDSTLPLASGQLRAFYLERVNRTSLHTVLEYTVGDFTWTSAGWALCDWLEVGYMQIAGGNE